MSKLEGHEALPIVAHGKTTETAPTAIPIKVTSTGEVVISGGMSVSSHDEIVLGYTDGNVTTITYKLASATVATKTLTYTDGNLTGITIA